MGKDAYILFYQKSSLSASSSASSSSSGSNQDHWVYRMPDFYYKAKNETKSAPAEAPRSKASKRNTKKIVNESKTNTENETESNNERFTRNSRKYATMPAKRTSDLIQVDTENCSDTEQGAGAESDDDTDSPSR